MPFEKIYDKQDFPDATLPKETYEQCTFRNLILENADLSDCKFIDCVFENCNLSLAKLQRTLIRDVQFLHCKMLGLQFDTCNPFGLSLRFEHCQLQHASFYTVNISKTVFRKCGLTETDFTQADMSGVLLEDCDLSGAVFEHTKLEKADFRSAINYQIDPDKNSIRHAKFSITGLPGLLARYQIDISY